MKNLRTSNLKQIQKRTAKKLYNDGITLYLVPSNIYPDFNGNWIRPISINFYQLRDKYMGDAVTFKHMVNEFEYYNCQYSETGLYTNFYIKH